jgi:hypothetical protein
MIASTVPGAAMGHMTASAAENQAKIAQGAARVQSRMAQGMQMMAFMPKLMRGQRLIELATVRKCAWVAGVSVPSIPKGRTPLPDLDRPRGALPEARPRICRNLEQQDYQRPPPPPPPP